MSVPDRHTVVVIGAAGEVARVVVRTLLDYEPGLRFVLADVNRRSLTQFAAGLASSRVTVRPLDLFDSDALGETIRGAALVVNGAGPFTRTAQPVIDACVREQVDYLDYDDDPPSTLAAIVAEPRLAQSGIRCLKNCGHSPGFTNVIAVEVADEFEQVESLDVCWALGEEGAHVYGPAVIEHWLDVIKGQVPTWRDGRATTVEAFAASEVYPLAGSLGEFRLYEVGHPEPITLPRRFGDVASIRCMGGLHPQPVNGLSRGDRRRGRPRLERADVPGGTWLATGDAVQGLEGFRRTHRQAREAQRIGMALRQHVTRYSDVAVEALALRDPAAARSFVEQVLGPVGAARNGGKLLQTLDAYLRCGLNAAAAASMIGVNDRTVAYRLRLVEELTGQPLAERWFQFAAALRLDRVLNGEAGQSHR